VSKEKKSRKVRTPNVPLHTGPFQPLDGVGGGGPDTLTARQAKAGASAPVVTVRASAGRSEGIQADYTHVVSDLRRISLLAGAMLVVLVALSFIIK
jgi:hypothetical protein